MSTPRHPARPGAPPPTAPSKARRCPICDLVTEAKLCPEHAMATLLVDAPSPSIESIEPGRVIDGRYVIQRMIGRGGYGAVFEARHTGTGQGVAIKTLAPGLEADDAALRRFFVEARVTSGLKHPNTVRVFDFGQDDSGLIFLAMELLSGHTLRTELKLRQKEGRVFSEREAIDIAAAVTRSLGEAHAAGLVHRDLKADNVFLHHVEGDDPAIKVLDFGIVKLADSQLTLGSDAAIPGTPAYMSPEQVTRKGGPGRSDLYALGVLLYNLVAGTVPFRGADVIQTLWCHVNEPVPDLRVAAKTPLSEAFVAVVERALAKDPSDRHADARAMRTALLACLGEGGRAGLHFDSGFDTSGAQPLLDEPAAEQSGDRTVPHATPSAPLRAPARAAREAALFTPDAELDRTLPATSPVHGDAGAVSGPVRVQPPGAPNRLSAAILVLLAVVGLLAGMLAVRLLAPLPPPTAAKPAEVKVAQPEPREVKPAEVKPAEVKPAEVKPAEVKPEAARPAEVAPAEVAPEPKLKVTPPQPKKDPSNRGKKGSDVLDIKI